MKLMKLSIPRDIGLGHTDDELKYLLSSKKILTPKEDGQYIQLQKVEKCDIDANFVHIYQDIDDGDMLVSLSCSELEATGIPANYNAVLIGHSPYTGVPIFGIQKKDSTHSLVSTAVIGDIYAHTS